LYTECLTHLTTVLLLVITIASIKTIQEDTSR